MNFNFKSSSAKWQTKVLEIVALLFIGMAIRDYVFAMYASLFELVTSDTGATVALGSILTLFYFIMNVLKSLTFNKSNRKENKPQTNNSFPHSNQNQNRR